MSPARSMSWWLMISASAGVSFTVLIGYWESLIAGASASRIQTVRHLTAGLPDKMPPCLTRLIDGSWEDTVEPEKQEPMEVAAPESARPRRKGIYLLPNLMTTGCLFSGFYGIVAAIDK